MTKIKLCGLRRIEDIETVNILKPDYIGFVFAPESKRYITPDEAAKLKKKLNENTLSIKNQTGITDDKSNTNINSNTHKLIKAVGVFVDEDVEKVAELLNTRVIDIAQLHGNEDENYIRELRRLITKKNSDEQKDASIDNPGKNKDNKYEGCIIKAFKIKTKEDLEKAKSSIADYILLDAGAGDGMRFNWDLLQGFVRPYFLAGGLDSENVKEAITKLHPYGVDVSSGIETDGYKDPVKMQKFVYNVRN